MQPTPHKIILVDAWNTFVTATGINQKLYAVLEQFPNTKIIVTNANAPKRIELGIVDMPYPVYSLDNNPSKSEPEYYHLFLKEHSLTAANVVYFEHNPSAVQAARSVGIATLQYDPVTKDSEAVRQFLLAALHPTQLS